MSRAATLWERVLFRVICSVAVASAAIGCSDTPAPAPSKESLAPATVAETVAPRTVKLGAFDFTVRTGPTEYSTPYADASVEQLAKGRIRLHIKKDPITGAFNSAGLLGPVLGNGTYVWEVTGRLDGLDPSAVFAIWFIDDLTKKEIDVCEHTRWSDPNQPSSLYITAYDSGSVKLLQTAYNARSFGRYRYTLNLTNYSVGIIVEGQYPVNNGNRTLAKTWKEVANFWSARAIDYSACQLRAAIWIPVGQPQLCMPDATTRGPMYVTLDSMTFTPAPTKG